MQRPLFSRINGAHGAVVGASLVGGWVSHDLAIVVMSSNPLLALRMIWGSIALVMAAAALGWLLGASHRAVFLGILATVAITAGASTVSPPAINPAFIGLAKSLFLLLAAAAVTVTHKPTWRLHAFPIGLVLAAVASLRQLRWRQLTQDGLAAEGLLALLAIGLLMTGGLRATRARRLLTVSLVLVGCLAVAGNAAWRSRLRRADLPPPTGIADRQAASLLLITLDTVRADRLSVYGYQRDTMPGLHGLVEDGFALYREARSTSSWTLPSHGSLLTGLMPHQHGATHARTQDEREAVLFRWSWATRLREDVPTLAERLAGRGYRTGAIVANSAVLAHEMGLDRGFQHYDDRMSAGLQCRQSLLQQLGWHPALGCLLHRDATTVTDLAQSWLEGNDANRPFFLFLNYMDAHAPYIPHAPFDRAFAPQQPIDPLQPPQAMQSLQYDRQLLYLDSELMRLIDWLRSTPHWQRTVVIITSDHGEAFGEHDHWGHAQYLYEELLHVPLLVKSVGAQLDRPLTQLIGGDKVHDLALAELGLGAPPQLPSERLVAEWYCSAHMEQEGECRSQDLLAWFEGNRKLIVQATGEIEAYDLGKDQQELARIELSESETDRIRQRAAELWAIPPAASTSPKLSRETIENLKALGYLK
jgi:hypothetical protein